MDQTYKFGGQTSQIQERRAWFLVIYILVEQFKFKLKKILGFTNMQEKFEKENFLIFPLKKLEYISMLGFSFGPFL